MWYEVYLAMRGDPTVTDKIKCFGLDTDETGESALRKQKQGAGEGGALENREEILGGVTMAPLAEPEWWDNKYIGRTSGVYIVCNG